MLPGERDPASVSVFWMERLLTVVFGPSRSKRFGKAVEEARRLARECSEIEPGKYRARFLLVFRRAGVVYWGSMQANASSIAARRGSTPRP
jgi:hypothetical protein